MAIAKRHHTVPQYYLRGFADGERISTVRLPGEHRFVQSVRKAASETNFYTVDGHEEGADVFERVLASVENEAASVFAAIVDGVWPLEPEDRTNLAYFIGLQAVRGPDQRRNMEYVASQTARLEIGLGGRAGVREWIQRNRGISITDEDADLIWDQATRPEGPPIRLSPIAHIEQIAGLSEALLPYITGRPWTLIRFERRSLITCDSPVGLIPHAGKPPRSGVGFMTAWGVAYPVTRKLGLLLSDPMVIAGQVPVEEVRIGRLDAVLAGTTKLERFFNSLTASTAREWIYHHPEDEPFLPDTLPQPNPVTMRMDGGPEDFSGEPMFQPRQG